MRLGSRVTLKRSTLRCGALSSTGCFFNQAPVLRVLLRLAARDD